MKQNLLVTLLLFLTLACRRSDDDQGVPCTNVTITNAATGCGGWGIIYNGVKYPSCNIDDAFKTDGLVVCAHFNLYEDLALCPCCGGTWAEILSMQTR